MNIKRIIIPLLLIILLASMVAFGTNIPLGPYFDDTYFDLSDSALILKVVPHEKGGLEADVSAYDGLIKITGGATSNLTIGIGDDNIIEMDDADAAVDDYCKLTANGIVGRSYSEVRTDLGLVIGTNVQAYDDGLLSLAGLTYASPSFIKVTAEDVYAIRTIAETKTDLSLNYVENLKVKLDATQAPTVNNDIDEGYVAGSRWVDVTNDKEYVCLDNTDGAAVWTETTGAGGGASTFLGLTDTPAAYTDQAGKYVKVNAGETALEFGTPTGGAGTFLELTDTPAAYDNGKYAKSTVDGVVWDTPAGGGDVTKVGTPANSQVGVWTGDGTIEGTANLTYDGSNLQFTGDLGATGSRINKGWFANLETTGDLTVNGTALASIYQPLDTALTNISALAYISPSFIKLTAEDTYAVRTLAEVKTDLAYELSDLSDVNTSTSTDKFVLIADGVDFESRVLIETDISDLGTYLENVIEDTTPELGGEMDCGAHSIGFTLQTDTGTGAKTIDWRLGNKFKFTFGAGNVTFTFTAPTNPCTLMLTLIQDGTGSRTITWPATVKWPGGTEGVLTTTANARDKVALDWDGSQYDCQMANDFK